MPFAGIASQQTKIFTHMGMYSDPDLLKWFVNEFPKHSKQKLDMGKAALRFKKMDDIPLQTHWRVDEKMTVKEWILKYEVAYKPKAKVGES